MAAVSYRVSHRTRYDYDEPVTLCHNLARLGLRETANQQVRSASLWIEPRPDDQRNHLDSFGNAVTYFSIDVSHDALVVHAESLVDVTPPPPPVSDSAWEASVLPAGAMAGEGAFLRELTLPSPLVPALDELTDFARPSFPPGRPALDAVLDLLARIHDEVTFDPGVTTVATPLSEVVDHRHGVCQDFAHLAVGSLRSMGLAARYVSGYLETEPAPGQPRLVGVDASHAWSSVWLADHGWLDLDPTNGHLPGEHHITVAWGRDYGDVTPLKGVVFAGGGNQRLTVEVDVTRI